MHTKINGGIERKRFSIPEDFFPSIIFLLGREGGGGGGVERRNLLNIQYEGLSSRNLVEKNLDEQTAKVNHREKNMKILIFE